MLSLSLQHALERDVVGQPRAVQTIVRTVTSTLGGLLPQDDPLGVLLFVGPTGTGKTHLARATARVLHRDDPAGVVLLDCRQSAQDWGSLVRQLAPAFRHPAIGHCEEVAAATPGTVILVEHLEAAKPELARALVSGFSAGRLVLPDGKQASVERCLVLITTGLCAREIYALDRQEIGFSPSVADVAASEKARIYGICCDAAEKKWGSEFLAHLDDLVVFHRLTEAHLPFVLDRQLDQLNQSIAARRLRVSLSEASRSLLLERGGQTLQHGARLMVRVFRRFVVFPVADLMVSQRIAPGSRIDVDFDVERGLCFAVSTGSRSAHANESVISVDWADEIVDVIGR